VIGSGGRTAAVVVDGVGGGGDGPQWNDVVKSLLRLTGIVGETSGPSPPPGSPQRNCANHSE
jgi:hypothetical protein